MGYHLLVNDLMKSSIIEDLPYVSAIINYWRVMVFSHGVSMFFFLENEND